MTIIRTIIIKRKPKKKSSKLQINKSLTTIIKKNLEEFIIIDQTNFNKGDQYLLKKNFKI